MFAACRPRTTRRPPIAGVIALSMAVMLVLGSAGWCLYAAKHALGLDLVPGIDMVDDAAHGF
ncbi:MAG: hypothetical protein RID91_01060 [Azospirillaceae bacterium]